MQKKSLLGMVLLVCFWVKPALAYTTLEYTPFPVTAKSAILVEAATGKVLYAKNADEQRYPASTTKIMTLITALEQNRLDDTVIASSRAVQTEGSSLELTEGEPQKMLDLLYGIMLISGNDATVAVAEHLAGSVENFAHQMTAKAHQIGAVHSQFMNTSGLPDPNHFTTARDLAIITAYGYRNPIFKQIVSTKEKIIPWQGRTYSRDLFNENKLLWNYAGANGVKTGYTEIAGPCLVSAAERDGIQLIAVVLNSDAMWEDSKALLDYGFANLSRQTFYRNGDTIANLPVLEGKNDDVGVTVVRDAVYASAQQDEKKFTTVVDMPKRLWAPIASGQKVGELKVFYENRQIDTIDLITEQKVEKKSFFGTLWGSLEQLVSLMMRTFV